MAATAERLDADTTSQVAAIGSTTEVLDKTVEDRLAALLAIRDRGIVAGNGCLASLRGARRRIIKSVPPGSRRVLLVDDEPEVLYRLRRQLLEVADFVDIAASVGEALLKVEERDEDGDLLRKFDVIVVDYQLTNGTAAEIAREARRGSHPVHIILMSDIKPPGGEAIAKSIQADAYLRKPADPDELASTIQAMVHRVLTKDVHTWARA